MSVQNLRNKFSQNADGGPSSLSSPGTCFGATKFSSSGDKLRTANSNGTINSSPPLKINSILPSSYNPTATTLSKPSSFLANCNAGSTLPKQTVSLSNNMAHNQLSKQNSYGNNESSFNRQSSPPTYAGSNNTNNGVRAVKSIANRWGTITVKKPPEQSREDIIRNRWNKNVSNNNAVNNVNNNNNNNNNNNSNNIEDVGYKSNVGKYLTQVVNNHLNNESTSYNNNNIQQYNHNNGSINSELSDKVYNNNDEGMINADAYNTVHHRVVNGFSTNGADNNHCYNSGGVKATSRYTIHLNNNGNNINTTDHSRSSSIDSNNSNYSSTGITNGGFIVGHNNHNAVTNGHAISVDGKDSHFNSSNNASEDEDLKIYSKWENAEAAKKDLSSQKALKDYNELRVKYDILMKEHNETKQSLFEKSEQLLQLRNLSEAMCKEYDQLKTQYDLESTTMQKTIERASEWYKQNRELKRRSSLLMQHVMTVVPEKIPEMMDVADGCLPSEEQDTEIDELRKTISGLNKEISCLKVELNSITSNDQHYLSLQDERTARLKAERQYQELEMKYNQLYHSTNIDSQLASKGVGRYQENSSDYTKLEEKLNSTESELNSALQRAKLAEEQLYETAKRVAELEKQLNSAMNSTIPQPPPLPAAIPPPPPLPTLSPNGTIKLKIQKQHHNQNGSNNNEDDSATDQMATLLGIQRKTGLPQVEGDTIDKIINELKGGRFTLKSTEKQNTIKKEEEEPAVVHEMRNILGTLRRQPARRDSFKQRKENDSIAYQ